MFSKACRNRQAKYFCPDFARQCPHASFAGWKSARQRRHQVISAIEMIDLLCWLPAPAEEAFAAVSACEVDVRRGYLPWPPHPSSRTCFRNLGCQ